MGKSVLPAGDEERSWLYAQFEQTQSVADAVPDDRSARLWAAIMLANFGRNDEAVDRLEDLVKQHPNFYNAQLILGGIYHYLGESDRASERFRLALSDAKTAEERSTAHLKMGRSGSGAE
jgi:Tfp pilus assembly protein PilF